MDATAVSLCMENKLPILVFNLRDEGNIRRVVTGEPIGTVDPLRSRRDDRGRDAGRGAQDGSGASRI